MCFLTKCPYVPPHEFNIDFPHLMLRYRAVEHQKGERPGFWEKQLTATDRNGHLCSHMSGLANWASKTGNGLTRPLMEKVAGVDRKGYLDGAALQTFFAWPRPNDLIWGYVTNNYLLGRTPPAFDILFWNDDTTRMSAGLLRDLADMAVSNALAEPDAMELLGTPIDLGKVTCDAYVVAGVADHITPWENCYATTQLFATQRDLKKARYDYLLNGLRLENAVGSLDENDLNTINALLAR